MPRGRGRLVLDNFLGGLNVRDDPVNLDTDESPDLRDFVPYGEGGAIVQRGGDLIFRDLATGPLLRLFYTYGPGLILAYEDTAGQVISTSGASQTTLYNPGASAVYNKDTFWAVEAPVSGGQGPIYFRAMDSAGLDVFRQSSGSAASAAWTASAGTLPQSHWFLYFQNRVWGFARRNAIGGSWVDWSALGDPRNWPAANTLQLDPGDGQEFTGAGVVGDVLVVFKRNKAWRIYDSDTGANTALGGPDVGAKAMDTMCSTPVGLFFIDPGRGPMTTDGLSSRPLENGTKVPWETFEFAVYLDDHIYCIDSDRDWIYDYSLRTKSWWRHTGGFGSLAVDSAGNRLLAARDADDRVFQAIVDGALNYAAGSAVIPYLNTAYLALDAPPERKRIRRMQLVGDGVADVSIVREVGATVSTLASGSLAAPGLTVPTPGLARVPRLRVEKDSGATPLRLDQIVFDFSVRQK